MFALVRYAEDGILHICHKKHIRRRNVSTEARYLDRCFYPATILCAGPFNTLSEIHCQLLQRPFVLVKDVTDKIVATSTSSNAIADVPLNHSYADPLELSNVSGDLLMTNCYEGVTVTADDHSPVQEGFPLSPLLSTPSDLVDTVTSTVHTLPSLDPSLEEGITNNLHNIGPSRFLDNFKPCETSTTPANASLIERVSKTRKHLFCHYCKRLQLNLSRHLERQHSDEHDVRLLREWPKGSGERKRIYHRIRSMGSHDFNTNSLHNDGSLLVTRRPAISRDVTAYLPCPNCGAFYIKRNLYRHTKICPVQSAPSNIYESRKAARRYHPLACEALVQHNFPPLLDDEVTKILKFDKTIVSFGNALTLKYRQPHLHYHIRQIMRTVARFLITMISLNSSIRQLSDIFKPQHYDIVLQSVNILAQYNPLTGSYKVPSIAPRLGTYIKRCCDLYIIDCIKMGNADSKRVAKDFLKIFQTDYSASINKTATETMNESKRNKKIELPSQADVNKLRTFLYDNIVKAFQDLSHNFSFPRWSQLSKYTLCYLQLFNRKRAGEIERLLITDYKNAEGLDKEKSSVLYNSLTPDEQVLAQNFVKVEIRGKLGRTVPIIVRREHLRIIDFLILQRQTAGIHPSNPYVFACPPGQFHHFRACLAMKQCASECGASNPLQLRGTALRKHLATTAQILELGENTMGRLANFMGHDIAIHKEHYRLPSTAVDLSQTSKILTIMEGENVEQYRGKSLLQINHTAMATSPATPSTSQHVHHDVTMSPSPSDSGSDFEDTQDFCTKATKKRLVPVHPYGKTIRRRWTPDEKTAVHQLFKSYIEDQNLPSYSTCVEVRNRCPQLSARSPTHIKAYINNEINRRKRLQSTKTKLKDLL